MATNSVNNIFQVKVTEYQGEKQGIFKQPITQHSIFSYITPEGKTNEVKIVASHMDNNLSAYKKNLEEAKTYLTGMNSYSTEENPEITPKEIFQIKENVTQNTKGTSIIGNSNRVNSLDSVKRSDYFQLLDLYSNPESDGGKNITPQEQSKVVDTFVKWYYKN